jgi:hypothetical protein
MTKRIRDFSLVAAAILLLSLAAAASPCDVKNLPEQIQSSLTGDFAGWKVVISSTLEASDRGTWLENYYIVDAAQVGSGMGRLYVPLGVRTAQTCE